MPSKKSKDKKQLIEEMPKDQASSEEPPRTEEKPVKSSGKTKDELWEECVSLQEKLEGVREQKKCFKNQRDKAQRSWDNSRRNLEEAKDRMREKLRQQQEAQKQRRKKIEEQEQLLKHMQTEHNSEICQLKIATAARNENIEREARKREREHCEKRYALTVEKTEKRLSTQISFEELKLKQKQELRQLKNNYLEQSGEMGAQYLHKMKAMFEENKKKTDAELAEIDKRMKIRADQAKEKCDRALERLRTEEAEAEVYRRELPGLRRKHESLEKQARQLDEKTAAATEENKRLKEAMSIQEAKLLECDQELALQRKAKAKSLKKSRKFNEHMEKENCELLIKHCQLERKYEQLQREYEERKKWQAEMILQVQQKSGLKQLLTERKIAVVSEALEKAELKLWVALIFTEGDRKAIQNIKELFESKQATIKALREGIARDLKEYNKLAGKPIDSDMTALEDTSEDKDINSLMQEVMALCISKDDEQGPNPAGAKSGP